MLAVAAEAVLTETAKTVDEIIISDSKIEITLLNLPMITSLKYFCIHIHNYNTTQISHKQAVFTNFTIIIKNR